MAVPKLAARTMTVDEFAVWDGDDPSAKRWQLIDGVPVSMAPAADPHGSIVSEIARLIGNHLLATGRPCRVVSQPGVVPRVRSSINHRVPDLGVTCAQPSSSLYIEDPVLLIEVLSPSNEPDTRANVWAYTTIPSVTEILLVRSTRVEAELLRRQTDGSWPASPFTLDRDATLELASIGLMLPLRDLYRTTTLGG